MGPADRLLVGLGVAADPGLANLLMTTDFADSTDLAAVLEARYSLRPGAARDIAREVWSSQLNEARPIAGVLEAMRALYASGLCLALLSNIWRPYAMSVRRSFGTFFDAAIPADLQCLSYQVGIAKPAPELLARLLARAAVPRSRAVMVGDSVTNDIVPAVRLGINTILIGDSAMAGAQTVANRQFRSVAELTEDEILNLVDNSPAK